MNRRKVKFFAILILALITGVETFTLTKVTRAEAIFEDGFESGNFSSWSNQRIWSSGTITVTNTRAHHGTYSCKVTFKKYPDEAWTRKTFSGRPEVYGRWYVYIDRLPDSDGDGYGFGGFGGTTNDYCGYMYIFRVSGNYVWRLRYFDGWTDNWQDLSGVDPPAANTWFCIEIYSKAGRGTAEYKAWINGVLGCSISGKNQPQNLVWFEVGGIQQSGSSDVSVNVYADCAVVADAYIGPEVEIPPQPVVYKISINSTLHENYGLGYPVTYSFIIPRGSSNLKAYKRCSLIDNWVELIEKTPNDFFNGIECVRFDYTNNKAYVSVAFSSISDEIYIKVTNERGDIIPILFAEIAKYYDDRKAVVVASADDWDGNSNRHNAFMAACDAFQQAKVWLTVGVTTQGVINLPPYSPPNWTAIQQQLNEGYIEVASHSRTHSHVPYNDYDSEIGGSKSDILNNLTLPYGQYVWAWIEPFGESDDTVRQKLGQYKYLISRTTIVGQNGLAAWDSQNGLFQRYGVTIKADDKTISELNNAFNNVYNGRGIYHLFFHPASFNWDGSNVIIEHLNYIKNKAEVWYVGLGALYIYNFVKISCSIKELKAPTIGEFQAPSKVYANKYFLLNTTIQCPNGATNIINATVELSNGIILKWDNATNAFTKIQDTHGYCTLDASDSFKTTINSTAYKLSWKIKLGWTCPEGPMSVISANTKVFDNQGLIGSAGYGELFTFEDDIIIYSVSVDDFRIDPSQPVTVTGILYYEGTTIPPEDPSGITVKANLEEALKGSTTTIKMDGTFTINFAGELNVGQYSYIIYATTDENSVKNQTISIVVDKIQIINGGVSKESLTVGETVTIWFQAIYEYDSTIFGNVNGFLYVNNSQMSWSVSNKRWEYNYVSLTPGTKTFVISGVFDSAYGLTVIDDSVGAQSIEVWASPFSIVSNSTITELTFNSTSKTITFTVSGPTGTIGFANVTIAKSLIQDISNLTVHLDGTQIDYIYVSNEDAWLVHFTYSHSSHKVVILLNSLSIKPQEHPLSAIALCGILFLLMLCLLIISKKIYWNER
ncbi:MAG: hypothetical protein QXQ94_06770 [Candidatus Bathyarchaeia archaeon]